MKNVAPNILYKFLYFSNIYNNNRQFKTKYKAVNNKPNTLYIILAIERA